MRYYGAVNYPSIPSMNHSRGAFNSLFLTLISLLLTAVILGSMAYIYLDNRLPDVQALKDVQLPIPLRVYTSDGQLISEFGELRSNPVTIDQVPPLLIKAIIATEDQRFFQHSGVDFLGLLRASAELIMTGTKSEGGSTITMQVARNFYLTRKKTFVRKFTEILLALKIERELTKDQILELYLNKIYLGNRAYGIAAAAHVYYGKSLNQLTLPEIATIAGLPKAPSTINPIANPEAAKNRRNHVLTRMHDLGYIDQKTYRAAMKAPIMATYHGPVIPVPAPYVAEMVRDMMTTSFGNDAYTKGYNVYTTISSQQQLAANQSLRDGVLAYDQRHGYRGPTKNLGAYHPNHLQRWLDALDETPTINGLQPAAVVNVEQRRITALLRNNILITIPWKGMSWARPITRNGMLGAAPQQASDVAKVGDLIRVQLLPDGSWQFAQVPKVEAAFVALNPNDGAITALVGGFDFNRSNFNRVTQAYRQPGSGFKPFIYAAALAKGYTLASEFDDAPISFKIPGQDTMWRPKNDDDSFGGPTRLRYALAESINLVSIRLLEAINVPYALDYLTRFGFDKKKLPRNLTLILGTADITPLELVRGYAVFANGGYRVTPYFIDHVTDSNGNPIYQAEPKVACTECASADYSPSAEDTKKYAPQAIPADIAFLMTSALKDVIRYGTGHAAMVLNRKDLAGKTGTTNASMDTWFSGFNSNVVATAWMGFDQPDSLHEFGAQAALPMWIDFMKIVLNGQPEATMPEPADIVTATIDPETGLLATNGMEEYFRQGTVPEEMAPPTTDQAASGDIEGYSNNDSDTETTTREDPLF